MREKDWHRPLISSFVSGHLLVFFDCYAPQTALTFTVPSYITLAIPRGSGYLSLTNAAKLLDFQVTGRDYAYAYVSELMQAWRYGAGARPCGGGSRIAASLFAPGRGRRSAPRRTQAPAVP